MHHILQCRLAYKRHTPKGVCTLRVLYRTIFIIILLDTLRPFLVGKSYSLQIVHPFLLFEIVHDGCVDNCGLHLIAPHAQIYAEQRLGKVNVCVL